MLRNATNNSLPTKKNLARRSLVTSNECTFCLCPESLLHVVAGCQHYWRHDSILKFISETLQTLDTCKLYADLPGILNPSIITGDQYRPDILLITPENTVYIIELTVGFESNLYNDVTRKRSKYKDVIKEQQRNFNSAIFINLSISSLGTFDLECILFLEMLDNLGLDKNEQQHFMKKIMSIAIRTTYYIFCCRNRVKKPLTTELLVTIIF